MALREVNPRSKTPRNPCQRLLLRRKPAQGKSSWTTFNGTSFWCRCGNGRNSFGSLHSISFGQPVWRQQSSLTNIWLMLPFTLGNAKWRFRRIKIYVEIVFYLLRKIVSRIAQFWSRGNLISEQMMFTRDKPIWLTKDSAGLIGQQLKSMIQHHHHWCHLKRHSNFLQPTLT